MLRTDLLTALRSVSPGIGKDEHGYVHLRGDEVISLDEGIGCCFSCPTGVIATVPYQPLVQLLERLDDDEVSISSKDGELLIQAGRGRAGMRCASEDRQIQMWDTPSEWLPVPDRFSAAVDAASKTVAKQHSRFELCCLHLTPDCIEGCDGFQWLTWPMKTGLTERILIQGGKHISAIEPTELAQDEAWLHFRTTSGLTLSCRRYELRYPELGQLAVADAQVEGIVLPVALMDAARKAEIFADSDDVLRVHRVCVELGQEQVTLEGRGQTGWYKESFPVDYSGPALKFSINPDLLCRIVSSSCRCTLLGHLDEAGHLQRKNTSRMVVHTDQFTLGCALYLD